MRIEVLVDVKTTLGEGPLWDVEEQDRHRRDDDLPLRRRRAGNSRLGSAAEDRLDGVAPERRRGAVAGSQACSVGKFDDWQPDVFMV